VVVAPSLGKHWHEARRKDSTGDLCFILIFCAGGTSQDPLRERNKILGWCANFVRRSFSGLTAACWGLGWGCVVCFFWVGGGVWLGGGGSWFGGFGGGGELWGGKGGWGGGWVFVGWGEVRAGPGSRLGIP